MKPKPHILDARIDELAERERIDRERAEWVEFAKVALAVTMTTLHKEEAAINAACRVAGIMLDKTRMMFDPWPKPRRSRPLTFGLSARRPTAPSTSRGESEKDKANP